MNDDDRITLALSALAEVVDPGAVGRLVDASVPAPGVIDLRFAALQPGYIGWFWTVSTSAIEDVEPTVLELELLPGEGALVAPAWVPWEERLADWRRAHPAGIGEDDADDEDEDDDEDLDDEDEDAVDEDDAIGDVLEDGDLKGVDVDAAEDEAEETGEDGQDESEGAAGAPEGGRRSSGRRRGRRRR